MSSASGRNVKKFRKTLSTKRGIIKSIHQNRNLDKQIAASNIMFSKRKRKQYVVSHRQYLTTTEATTFFKKSGKNWPCKNPINNNNKHESNNNKKKDNDKGLADFLKYVCPRPCY